MTTVLRVTGAYKRFAAAQALDGAEVELQRGELLLLLGPNGAGKTTLIRSVAGRVRLDRGRVELLGRPLDGPAGDARRSLGVVPQEIALYPLLTARENLEVFGTFHGLAGAALAGQVADALGWTGLADRAAEPVKGFSGGMKRRLNIACGVIHEPKVVLLDEPTVGVDPQSRERIYDMLSGLTHAGVSLLLTTHHLEEAEARCTRTVIIDHGRIIAAGSLSELVEQTVGRHRLVTLRLDAPVSTPPNGAEIDADDARLVRAKVSDVARELPALLAAVTAQSRAIEDVEVRSPSLQSVFIHLTGRELRE
jgi:ABC-2 type transport system ATP-binding protein